VTLQLATTAGSTLVLAVVQESGTTSAVTTAVDDVGDSFVSANERAIDTSCANTSELWYAKDVLAGAKKITITLSSAATTHLWALEVAGLDGSAPLGDGAQKSTQPTGTLISAPAVTTTGPSLVVSVAGTCGQVNGIQPPFTNLPPHNGHGAAYVIATSAGSYGAVWTYSGGTWNASTAAFH
jgi:hypothetical protein